MRVAIILAAGVLMFMKPTPWHSDDFALWLLITATMLIEIKEQKRG